MSRVSVAVEIEATPARVWEVVEPIENHVDWMADAVAIRVTSSHNRGIGVTFDCDTKVGPLKLTDKMEIVEWLPGSAMGVRHSGIVTGAGRFTLTPLRGLRGMKISGSLGGLVGQSLDSLVVGS